MPSRTEYFHLEHDAQNVLRAWRSGLIDDDAVTSWTERIFVDAVTPGELPGWLYVLSEKGPSRCHEMSVNEFTLPWPEEDYRERVLLALVRTDLSDRAACEDLIWVAARCSGEDQQLPEVQLGYTLQHLVVDCNDMNGAVARARKEFPKFVAAAEALTSQILASLRSTMPAATK